MIKIGKTYITRRRGISRLCANITIEENSFILWFAVDSMQEAYLCGNRADAFVMALLPTAIWGEHEIICEDMMSERLQYQLNDYLIPALISARGNTRLIQIHAPLTQEQYPNMGAVGTLFSDDIDSFYTIASHGIDCEYPLTHIAVFNSGVFDGVYYRKKFRKSYFQARKFAEEQKLLTVYVDTNFHRRLYEKFIEVGTFRNFSCVLALQGLFSVFLHSSKNNVENFKLDISNDSYYDLLTTNCASTESLLFYCSGAEVKYSEKLQIHMDWENIGNSKSISSLLSRFSESKRYRKLTNRKACSINIGMPFIEKSFDNVRLCAEVELYGQKQVMWFSVKGTYGGYLTEDRADAFVVALFMTAMRDDADIICEAPVTHRLLYQINHYLIPMMANHMEGFHHIKIYAQASDIILDCAGAVGTGWTAGVDCMFTYFQNLHTSNFAHKLTHLLVANNGAIEGDTRETFRKMIKKTENGFAAEVGLSVIGVDTNLQEILNENFIAVAGMRQAAVALALQRLFSIFLHSSSYSISNFSFSIENVGYYEWIALNHFETDNVVFYSSGGIFSRGQKLKELSSFDLAQRYLHPCVFALKDNCGRCGKCIRTESVLYGLGVLDKFSKVFDVEAFEYDKDWYFEKLLIYEGNTDCKEALDLLQRRGVDLSSARRKLYEKTYSKEVNL